jgi:hypothetical protein
VLDGIKKADNPHMQETAQVKMGKWTQGRVALLGDAGCCLSPISGMGTSLAIVVACVLAGEIVKGGLNYEEAFQDYEKIRLHVAKAQSLPPGAPDSANPQTKWGIPILNGVVSFISWSGLAILLGKFLSPPVEDKSLPT